MEKAALANKYEAVVIVDARLNNEEKESIIKEITDMITRNGGHIINSQLWLERHKLAFRIKKCTDGSYFVVSFEDDGPSVPKIHQALRLNEKILRFAIINNE